VKSSATPLDGGVHFRAGSLYSRMKPSLLATTITGRYPAGGKLMRATILVTALCFSLASLATAADAEASMKRTTAIPPQALAPALQRFVKERDIQLVYRAELIANLQTRGASGELTPIETLAQLLSGTGLSYRYLDDNTVTIVPLPAAAPISPTPTSANPKEAAGFWGRFRVAQATAASEGSAEQAGTAAEENASLVVEEVVVTAQKRIERLQDVPVPVTAINAASLVDSNQLRLQDYYSKIPGLTVVPSVQSNQTLSIRGITTGTGNPTVGVTVDDVPFGASTNTAGGGVVPDIDPGDLARVEVLRGPQGTLYGASSMGGLVKFVTRDPSMDGFSGRVQVGSSSVRNGDGLGYNARASVNVPLSDTLAIAGSGFTRREPGYIDNVQTGARGVNRADAQGGRLAALWRPSEAVSLKLTALVQQIEGQGSSSVDAALGDLEQSRLPGSGWYDRDAQAYSATLTAKLGSVDLTTISGYNINSFSDSLDAGFIFGAQAQALFGVRGAQLLSAIETKKFTQEVRLAGQIGSRVDWLLGGFYTNEDSEPTFTRVANNAVSGVVAGRLQFSTAPETFEEYAAFANLTFHVSERFDVQLGVRQSEIAETFEQTVVNAQGVVSMVPERDVKSNAFTYLVTPRLRLTPDLMVYARLASGYRAGGPNSFPGGVIPAQYEPDETRNYEIGLKGSFPDHSLSVDASVYYIEWNDIQFASLSPASTTYLSNGSGARSQGVELSVESRPMRGLTLTGWVAWNDAELTTAFPPGSTSYGVSGDRLPDSSRVSGNLSVEQGFPLWSEVSGFVGASATYVGERIGRFRAVPLRQTFPSYTQADLHAGVKSETWTANLYVTNVTDKRSALYGGLGALPATAFNYIQPRTMGVSLVKAF
jgi:iron complex outermembrane receptor protein